MKVVFMGVTQRKGISNKGQGKPYEMHRIHFATPIEPIETANMSFSGHGLQEQSLDVDPLCVKQFEALKPLTQVDVLVEPKPSNITQTWVVGLRS